MIAVIGGEPQHFRPHVDFYREAAHRAGHDPAGLQIGLHVFGFVAETTERSADLMHPGWQEMFARSAASGASHFSAACRFDATRGRAGAFFVGAPDTVVLKAREVSEALGGVDRIALQMTNPPGAR